MSGVNEQGFSCARWEKDIWNYKGERDLENCKSSCMLKPLRAAIFAKKVFNHHGTEHYKFCNVKNISKKLIFDGIEIPEAYFGRNQLSTG